MFSAPDAPRRETRSRRLINAAWALAALGAAGAYFWRVFQFSTNLPWTSGIGDWIDPYYVNVVLENWYRSVVSGHISPTPPMYFPEVAARYSHGFVLYAPIYIVFRLFTHPFVADTLTLAAVMTGGSWCLYLLLRRLGLAAIEAFIVSACCCSSPNLVDAQTFVWAQRASILMIPAILLALVAAIQTGRDRPRRKLALGGLAGLLSGLFLAQDFYTAALVGLLLGLLSLYFVVPWLLRLLQAGVMWIWRRLLDVVVVAKRVPRPQRPHWIWLAASGVCAAATAAFLIHPVDRFWIHGQGFSARDPWRAWYFGRFPLYWYGGRWLVALVRAGAPDAVAAVRRWRRPAFTWVPAEHRSLVLAVAGGAVPGVLVFLWIYLKPYLEFPTFPRQMIMEVLHAPPADLSRGLAGTIRAATPFRSLRMFEVALACVVMLWASARTVERRVRVQALWFVVLTLLVILMPLRFTDWSPWMTLFSWLPGMSAVRDPSRMIYPYELAVALLGAVWLTQLPRRSAARVAVVALAAGLTITDFRDAAVPYQRDRQVFDRVVRAPIQIDPSCRNFYIKGASATYMARSGHMWSLYAVDATFIALDYGIPTLNGYSAWSPDGWDLSNPQTPGYMGAVLGWIRQNQLHDTCELDIEARTMKAHVVRP